VPLIAGHAGPPLASLPLISWERLAQLGAPRPVDAAAWSSLWRFLEELTRILTHAVDHTRMMSMSRTVVRLRTEMAYIVSRPMEVRDSDSL